MPFLFLTQQHQSTEGTTVFLAHHDNVVLVAAHCLQIRGTPHESDVSRVRVRIALRLGLGILFSVNYFVLNKLQTLGLLTLLYK